ncbi:MAG: carboxypeptidase-like regulatory domain-containing protein [Candidatus Bathyarchaeia archaeon]
MKRTLKLHIAVSPILALWITSMLMALLVAAPSMAGAQSELQVSVSVTNEGGYTVITGIVTDSNHDPVEGARVSIQVNDPSGKTVHMELTYSDENGEFSDRFKMPEDINGECTIFVSASKSGYGVGGNTSSFTAIPEFSGAILALAAPLTFLLKAFKRKTR